MDYSWTWCLLFSIWPCISSILYNIIFLSTVSIKWISLCIFIFVGNICSFKSCFIETPSFVRCICWLYCWIFNFLYRELFLGWSQYCWVYNFIFIWWQNRRWRISCIKFVVYDMFMLYLLMFSLKCNWFC